jgi:hypothetical protein
VSIAQGDDGNTPIHTDDFYEELASQEEIYLEETEEEVRAILISYTPAPLGYTCAESAGDRSGDISNESLEATRPGKTSPKAENNLEEMREQAAADLITGDADDPPLSPQKIEEIMRII